MKILVTGTSGFIGSHLERQLVWDGHAVYPVDPHLNFSTQDFQQLATRVEAVRPEIIVHLGANCSTQRSLRQPYVDFNANVVGTVNVCEVASQHGLPVLFTSTVKVYPGYDGKVAPLGLSKRVAEDYIHQYGLRAVIDRPSTVYGPGQDGDSECGWVSWFIRASKEHSLIHLAGDGSQSRDILYINDFIELLIDQIENFSDYVGGTYDVGGGEVNEVSLNRMLEYLNYSKVDHVERLPGDLQRVVTDNSKVSSVRGWRPTTHWTDGVRMTWETM